MITVLNVVAMSAAAAAPWTHSLKAWDVAVTWKLIGSSHVCWKFPSGSDNSWEMLVVSFWYLSGTWAYLAGTGWIGFQIVTAGELERPALAAGRAKRVGREASWVHNWSRGDNAEAVGSGHGKVGTRHCLLPLLRPWRGSLCVKQLHLILELKLSIYLASLVCLLLIGQRKCVSVGFCFGFLKPAALQ